MRQGQAKHSQAEAEFMRHLRQMGEAGKDWRPVDERTHEPTQEEMLREFEAAVESHLNGTKFRREIPRENCPFVLKGVTDTPFCISGILDCHACSERSKFNE